MNKELDLSSQRLLLTRELGSFADALEGKIEPKEGQAEMVERVQNLYKEKPGLKILGTALTETSTVDEVLASLCRQMGLPPGSNWGFIRSRLVGRTDFILVFPGSSELPEQTRGALEKRAGGGLGVRTFWDCVGGDTEVAGCQKGRISSLFQRFR
ncbi:MAG: hypothetical protein ABID04_01740 [Patescibacteria group bacterium]